MGGRGGSGFISRRLGGAGETPPPMLGGGQKPGLNGALAYYRWIEFATDGKDAFSFHRNAHQPNLLFDEGNEVSDGLFHHPRTLDHLR